MGVRKIQLQRDVVRISELEDVAVADVFNVLAYSSTRIEVRCSSLQFNERTD